MATRPGRAHLHRGPTFPTGEHLIDIVRSGRSSMAVPRVRTRHAPLDVVVLAAGVLLFAVSSIRAAASYYAALGVPLFDWTFYAGAVNRWLAGEPIYPGARISTLGSAAGSSYAYPPASVPLMLPFASWPVGAVLWETLIVGTFLFGVWAVVRSGWLGRPLLVMGILLAIMSGVDAVMEGVAVGNVNIATAGALGFMWARTRGVMPGIGILGVIKVFPLFLAAPLGARALGRAAVVAGAICLVTLPLVGIGAWSDYITGLQGSEPLCNDPTWVNLSVACKIAPLVGASVAKWAGLALALVLVALAVRAGHGFFGAALVTGAVLAPATELHAHYSAIVLVLVVIGLANISILLRRDTRLRDHPAMTLTDPLTSPSLGRRFARSVPSRRWTA